MNIEQNFHGAEVNLEMAKEKGGRCDFAGSLACLVIAYEHTRALIEQVYKLQALKTEVELPAREDTV